MINAVVFIYGRCFELWKGERNYVFYNPLSFEWYHVAACAIADGWVGMILTQLHTVVEGDKRSSVQTALP